MNRRSTPESSTRTTVTGAWSTPFVEAGVPAAGAPAAGANPAVAEAPETPGLAGSGVAAAEAFRATVTWRTPSALESGKHEPPWLAFFLSSEEGQFLR
jgi:hypothetical protein